MLQKHRIDGLLDQMEAIGLRQMVVRSPILIRYLLDFTPWGADRATILYISRDNGIKLIVNELTIFPKDLDVELVLHGDQDDVCAVLARHTLHDQPLGFDGEYPARWLLPLRQYGAASDYVLADRALNLQRACKDPEEQARLRAASLLNDRVMARVRTLFADGVTERQVAQRITELFKEEGVSGGALVAFGENTAHVHHRASDRALRPGDAILIDMGAPLNGYHSDMTRTFFWKSVPPRQREIYDLVLQANLAAEAAIRPGMPCSAVDAVARDRITEAGFGPYFLHRLGHYIGLEGHDPGDIAWYNHDPVRPAMAFSCEPGVYLEGEFGVRIEDLVIVTPDGCEILNHDPKALEILGL